MLVEILTVGAANQVYKAEVFPHRLKEFYLSIIAFEGGFYSGQIVLLVVEHARYGVFGALL